jgi:hypothetical protein
MISRLRRRGDAKVVRCHGRGFAGMCRCRRSVKRLGQRQAALAFDFATWVAIASISAGDKQS